MAGEPAAVLDAFAMIALAQDEKAARRVEQLIRGGAAISAVNVAEVVAHGERRAGRSAAGTEQELASLGVRVDDAPAAEGFEAGRLRAAYYAPRTSEVSLADCFAAAHALALDLPLATADEPLALMLEAEGGRVIRLPRSA